MGWNILIEALHSPTPRSVVSAADCEATTPTGLPPTASHQIQGKTDLTKKKKKESLNISAK